jgi:hypothetical protein
LSLPAKAVAPSAAAATLSIGSPSHYFLVQASDCQAHKIIWRPSPSSLSKGAGRKPLKAAKDKKAASNGATSVSATTSTANKNISSNATSDVLKLKPSQCEIYFSTVLKDGVRVRYTQAVNEELLKYLHLGESDVYALPRHQLENLTEVSSIPTFEMLEVCAAEFFCIMTTKSGRKYLMDNTYFVRIALDANFSIGDKGAVRSVTHGLVGAMASFLDADDEWMEYVPLEDESIIPKAPTHLPPALKKTDATNAPRASTSSAHAMKSQSTHGSAPSTNSKPNADTRDTTSSSTTAAAAAHSNQSQQKEGSTSKKAESQPTKDGKGKGESKSKSSWGLW